MCYVIDTGCRHRRKRRHVRHKMVFLLSFFLDVPSYLALAHVSLHVNVDIICIFIISRSCSFYQLQKTLCSPEFKYSFHDFKSLLFNSNAIET